MCLVPAHSYPVPAYPFVPFTGALTAAPSLVPHFTPPPALHAHSPSAHRSQDRNAFDVIFGGHLLRLAYEHAFATAALHAGRTGGALQGT